MSKQLRRLSNFLLVVLIMGMSACQRTPAAVETTPTTAPTIEPTATLIPTNTPEPERVVWVSAQQDAKAAQIQATMQTLAQNTGMQFEAMNAPDPSRVNDAVRILVAYRPTEDYNGLAGQHPATQFVLITDQPLQPSANISVISPGANRVLFAGGFLTMLLANDWRAAGLIASDTSLGDAASWDFYNGGSYFCGRCSPLTPPYKQFPLIVSYPAATDAASWDNGYAAIEENRLNTVFIDGAITNQEIYTRMAQRGLLLLGSGIPPAGLESQWAATISDDVSTALETIWPDLLAGQPAGAFNAPITVSNVNPDLLGQGKINWLNEMLAELDDQLIAPEYQPTN